MFAYAPELPKTLMKNYWRVREGWRKDWSRLMILCQQEVADQAIAVDCRVPLNSRLRQTAIERSSAAYHGFDLGIAIAGFAQDLHAVLAQHGCRQEIPARSA
jgi:hypothetical protein